MRPKSSQAPRLTRLTRVERIPERVPGLTWVRWTSRIWRLVTVVRQSKPLSVTPRDPWTSSLTSCVPISPSFARNASSAWSWRVSTFNFGKPSKNILVWSGEKQADHGSEVERAKVSWVSLGALKVLRMAKCLRWVGIRSRSRRVMAGWRSSPTRKQSTRGKSDEDVVYPEHPASQALTTWEIILST